MYSRPCRPKRDGEKSLHGGCTNRCSPSKNENARASHLSQREKKKIRNGENEIPSGALGLKKAGGSQGDWGWEK